MKQYIESLASHLQENPITFDTKTSTPCLDALWWHYAGFHPIQSEKSKNNERMIREKLVIHENVDADEVMDLVGSLCTEYEKLAFTSGIKLGMQLMMESI